MLAVESPSTAIHADPAELLPAQPKTVRDSGLSQQIIVELIAKTIFINGKIHLPVLTTRLHLSINVLREALEFMVAEHVVEVAWRGESDIDVQYQLTSAGRLRTSAWMDRSPYVGPAPVTLDAYRAVVERQAGQAPQLCAEELAAEFADDFLSPAVQRMLGAAMHAGRTVLLHGPSGSGKSVLARRLGDLLQGVIAVPHALVVGQEIIQVYDALVHRAPAPPHLRQLRQAQERRSSDPRWVLCARPVVALDADLSADMLELQADSHSGCYRSPPQLKANNGLLIVDDLGRQRMAAADLLNRFSQARELERSQLALAGGYHFSVPCRMQLVFATSLAPEALLDAPALRRVGYKIPVGPLDVANYRTLFRQQCVAAGVAFDEAALRYLIEELHAGAGLPLLACYPREIIGRINDFAGFLGESARVSVETLEQAWISMFATGVAAPADAIDQLQRHIA
ncbi:MULTISPECIES: ATP-binding protein [unclassified Duganella]|uniref:ATP-binding protein n=1 Tax=unclassified Duganella TaxID=2636909 RepID=UPI000E357318|nr:MULTISPECIES: ATP-binding protein [unclassified Duganella]RFP12624.1 ATP-binding protein [Duganella sp. BJB475]RFP28600.1 ATP-binding protein [Duganella sp. BJB476]